MLYVSLHHVFNPCGTAALFVTQKHAPDLSDHRLIYFTLFISSHKMIEICVTDVEKKLCDTKK